jgi:hypothetical protein
MQDKVEVFATMPPRAGPSYEEDFYAWTQHQAAKLRTVVCAELDLLNLAEEIESLGKRDWKELRSRLNVLVMHLLKYQYQPDQRSGSWSSTIRTQRDEINALLEQSPSLRRQVSIMLAERYKTPRHNAADETRLPIETFPEVCPWTVEQVLDEDFWPEMGGQVKTRLGKL